MQHWPPHELVVRCCQAKSSRLPRFRHWQAAGGCRKTPPSKLLQQGTLFWHPPHAHCGSEARTAAPLTSWDSSTRVTPGGLLQGATVFGFKETEAGKYLLCVEYDGERLPGCPVPLTVNRRSTEDTRVAAPASRPHFSVPDKVKAGDQAPIHIDCPSCGPHSTEKPSVLVSEFCPSTRAEVTGSGSRAEVTVEQGKCRALWTPTRAGFYQVDVRLPGQSAACSRIVQVVPAAVASRQVVVRLWAPTPAQCSHAAARRPRGFMWSFCASRSALLFVVVAQPMPVQR